MLVPFSFAMLYTVLSMLDWYQFCIFEKEEKVLWLQIFNVGSSLPRRSAEGIGGPIPIEVDGQKVSPPENYESP